MLVFRLRRAEKSCRQHVFNHWVTGSIPVVPSLPKPATDSSLAEKPFLRPFLACGGLWFPVSARRHRLQAPFGAPVSEGKNPVPNSKRAGLRGDRADDGRVQMTATAPLVTAKVPLVTVTGSQLIRAFLRPQSDLDQIIQ